MAEFRFQGVVPSGKVIQGTLTASNLTDAKRKLQDLSKGRPFRVQKIEKRSTFLYKVQKGDDKPIMGEQKAFSKDEVASGLTSMGYKVLYVRKKWFDFQGKPKTTDIVTFVRLSADLLREQLPYNEILQLLSNDIESTPLRSTIKDIAADLRQGKEAEKVFAKHEGTLGKFVAKMLGLASKSGNMIDLYDSTAKFIERQQEFRKSMKSAMIMPSITLILLFLATLFYVAYIFPETARMFSKYGIELPPMTAATLEFSDWLVENIVVITFIHIAAFVGAFFYWKSDKGRFNIDKWVLKVPVLGSLIHKTIIEIFCRVFYSLYSGSGENIDVIRIASEATGNRYFEAQVKNVAIPMMLKHGKGLHESFEASGVFTKTALSRFHAGAETGTVRATALQLANYYERDTTYKLKAIVEYVQLFIALLIMVVMTAITIVSSETALIKPKQTPGFRGAEITLLLAFTSSITRKVRAWLSLLPRREKNSSTR